MDPLPSCSSSSSSSSLKSKTLASKPHKRNEATFISVYIMSAFGSLIFIQSLAVQMNPNWIFPNNSNEFISLPSLHPSPKLENIGLAKTTSSFHRKPISGNVKDFRSNGSRLRKPMLKAPNNSQTTTSPYKKPISKSSISFQVDPSLYKKQVPTIISDDVSNKANYTQSIESLNQKPILGGFVEIQKPLYSHTKPFSNVIFYPLRDPSVAPYTNPKKTWFMSTLSGQSRGGIPEHFIFSANSTPDNAYLCIDFSNKSYGFSRHVPGDFTLLRGLTFVADSYWDYINPWHSMNALAVFLSWMKDNGCPKPDRFVAFHNGELVTKLGDWIYAILEASLGYKPHAETMSDGYRGGLVCFEKAVIFRRGLGHMSGERRNDLFDMIRCKSWKYCNVFGKRNSEDGGRVRISLIGRKGKRGLKNESGVALVMRSECEKFEGCKFRLVHMDSLSFCQQVSLMRNTDILASPHGAQLTNMMFMPRGSRVMEMFPKGWLEGAGIGQFIYQWFASWSGLVYEGAWRDTDGPDCPNYQRQRSKCFILYKDRQIWVDETHLANWTTRVLRDFINRNQPLDGLRCPSGAKGPDCEACSCDNYP
ncbi:hypothetical protein AMTRI_Chr03g51310 [Amborella trichopoda]